MLDINDTKDTQNFWSQRYVQGTTGWDIGYPSTPLKEYIDRLEDKQLRILLPGAGNAYEAEYLFEQGFKQVFVLDIALQPLEALQARLPDFPQDQLVHQNFFEHEGAYDLILEQTFFCSFPPSKENRRAYAQKMLDLLKPGGLLVGLWFQFPLRSGQSSPPFGGSKEEYLRYFDDLFEVLQLDTASNSIPPRQGNELFGVFKKSI